MIYDGTTWGDTPSPSVSNNLLNEKFNIPKLPVTAFMLTNVGFKLEK
jgi:hypothetical protein